MAKKEIKKDDLLIMSKNVLEILSDKKVAVKFAASCAYDVIDRLEKVDNSGSGRQVLETIGQWIATPEVEEANAVKLAVHSTRFIQSAMKLATEIAERDDTNDQSLAMMALMCIAMAAEAVTERNPRQHALKVAFTARRIATLEFAAKQATMAKRLGSSADHSMRKPAASITNPNIMTELIGSRQTKQRVMN